ncbi:MAG TPA: F0F1 ATP synthase subunit A [Patescibacteria group bacterium]|nr:F0F1 ATP synthase subunit A [Patescibacteria group bacterium]
MATHSPLEQFVIKPIIPIHVGGYDLSFTQSSAWMLAAVVAATALMTLTMRRRALVPGRWQNIPEMFYEFIAGMVNDTLHEEGRKYLPLIFSLFMIVLMGNVLGLLPYSFTYTSHIIVTGALALMVFFLCTIIGFARHGLHFLTLFLPKGLPLAIAPLIVVIEIISYLSRPLSLSVRLFANMTAGHTMLKVFAGFSVGLISAGLATGVLSVIPVIVNVALVGLELMIAFIQAYVFAILTCIYLKDAIELH